MKMKKVCPCGKEFETYSKTQRCCSISCGNKYLAKVHKKVCAICGKEFETTRKQQVYCSIDCSIVAKIARNKEYARCHKTENRQREVKHKKKSNKKIDNLVIQEAQARQEGISYGQYKAKDYIEKYARVQV